MPLFIFALAGMVALMIVGLYACVLASLYHFRLAPRPQDDDLLPMTLIKPVRGLDEGIEENFESIARSDVQGSLQVIVALENEEDPVYPIAKAFAAAHPDRDILVLITGPAGRRMGKIHNMIEAMPRAKHPRVIFSDADVATTPRLLGETSRAFRGGAEAIFGLPYHAPAPGLGGLCFEIAFNHCFCVPAALSYYMGRYRFCAGAWMAYTKEALEKAGGLEQFSRDIADDFAISAKVSARGARKFLLHELVRVRETGTSIKEAFEHLTKWCAIIRWSLPSLYFAVPFLNLGSASLLLWVLCEASGRRIWLGRGLVLAATASRVALGAVQDVFVGRERMPWPSYLVLAAADLGGFVFWPFGFKSEILWRGTRYRLFPGGRSEVVGASQGPAQSGNLP